MLSTSGSQRWRMNSCRGPSGPHTSDTTSRHARDELQSHRPQFATSMRCKVRCAWVRMRRHKLQGARVHAVPSLQLRHVAVLAQPGPCIWQQSSSVECTYCQPL